MDFEFTIKQKLSLLRHRDCGQFFFRDCRVLGTYHLGGFAMRAAFANVKHSR